MSHTELTLADREGRPTRVQALDTAVSYQLSLAGLPRLEKLHLEGTKVTNACLKYLADLPSLRWLDLTRTLVSASGLRHLAGLVGLVRRFTAARR